jgi:predicted PurR-regulated permease PerM
MREKEDMETSRTQKFLFISALILVSLLFLYLLKPFFFPLFWAAVITGIFRPLFKKINGKLHRPSLSSAIVVVIICLILILPGSIIGSLLFTESMQIYESFDMNDSREIEKQISAITSVIKSSPLLEKLHVNETMLTEKLTEVAKSISNYIFINLKDLTQNTFLFVAQFAIMLYTLFFFIRDSDKFLEMAKKFFTFGQNRERVLYERFVATARSTLKVTLIIGGIQGALGGTVFFITGIEGALTWGVVMVLAAIIPVVGCSIVWAPASIIMLLTGHIWEGVLIIAVGVLVIAMIDNLLRPVLLGRDVQMHPVMIFLSTLGGISLFGFSGFVIGPIIASLLLAILTMYDQFNSDSPT